MVYIRFHSFFWQISLTNETGSRPVGSSLCNGYWYWFSHGFTKLNSQPLKVAGCFNYYYYYKSTTLWTNNLRWESLCRWVVVYWGNGRAKKVVIKAVNDCDGAKNRLNGSAGKVAGRRSEWRRYQKKHRCKLLVKLILLVKGNYKFNFLAKHCLVRGVN